jgi:hypothetical protein
LETPLRFHVDATVFASSLFRSSHVRYETKSPLDVYSGDCAELRV